VVAISDNSKKLFMLSLIDRMSVKYRNRPGGATLSFGIPKLEL